jgi:hypothetical protein
MEIHADATADDISVAAPPTSSPFGPDHVAVAWHGGDGLGHLAINDEPGGMRPQVDLAAADELVVACPLDIDAAAETLSRSGGGLQLALHDATGAVTASTAVDVGVTVRRLRGLVAPAGAVVGAVEGVPGWQLIRVTPQGVVAAHRDTDEVLALSLSADRALVLTAQLSGGSLVLQPYFAGTLEPAGDPTTILDGERLASGVYRHVALSSCAVAWSERRSDDSGAIDLRVADVDGSGAMTGESRVLNASWDDLHVGPALTCLSAIRAYAAFSQTTAAAGGGTLQLRKVPPPPPL